MTRLAICIALPLSICLLAVRIDVALAQPRGLDELKKVIPHIKTTCRLVREDPGLWPFRVLPFGPLSLEVRKGTPTEADALRNYHMGIAAASCEVPKEAITSYFFCGPECPKSRRTHLVNQLTQVRAAVSRFRSLQGLNVVSIWAPRGEIRVNDVFLLGKTVEEAVPSPAMGLVPSGTWRTWPNLAAYLTTIRIKESAIRDLDSLMRDVGLSALVREEAGIRAIGVGFSDNESGLFFLRKGGVEPVVGKIRPDGSRYQLVEKVSKDICFYETT